MYLLQKFKNFPNRVPSGSVTTLRIVHASLTTISVVSHLYQYLKGRENTPEAINFATDHIHKASYLSCLFFVTPPSFSIGNTLQTLPLAHKIGYFIYTITLASNSYQYLQDRENTHPAINFIADYGYPISNLPFVSLSMPPNFKKKVALYSAAAFGMIYVRHEAGSGDFNGYVVALGNKPIIILATLSAAQDKYIKIIRYTYVAIAAADLAKVHFNISNANIENFVWGVDLAIPIAIGFARSKVWKDKSLAPLVSGAWYLLPMISFGLHKYSHTKKEDVSLLDHAISGAIVSSAFVALNPLLERTTLYGAIYTSYALRGTKLSKPADLSYFLVLCKSGHGIGSGLGNHEVSQDFPVRFVCNVLNGILDPDVEKNTIVFAGVFSKEVVRTLHQGFEQIGDKNLQDMGVCAGNTRYFIGSWLHKVFSYHTTDALIGALSSNFSTINTIASSETTTANQDIHINDTCPNTQFIQDTQCELLINTTASSEVTTANQDIHINAMCPKYTIHIEEDHGVCVI